MCSSYSMPVSKLIWKPMCQMQWTRDLSCVGLVIMTILNQFTDFTWPEDYFKCVWQFHLLQTPSLFVVLMIQCICAAVNIVLSCNYIRVWQIERKKGLSTLDQRAPWCAVIHATVAFSQSEWIRLSAPDGWNRAPPCPAPSQAVLRLTSTLPLMLEWSGT